MARGRAWRVACVAVLVVLGAPVAWADMVRGGAFEEPTPPAPELSDVTRLILQVRSDRRLALGTTSTSGNEAWLVGADLGERAGFVLPDDVPWLPTSAALRLGQDDLGLGMASEFAALQPSWDSPIGRWMLGIGPRLTSDLDLAWSRPGLENTAQLTLPLSIGWGRLALETDLVRSGWAGGEFTAPARGLDRMRLSYDAEGPSLSLDVAGLSSYGEPAADPLVAQLQGGLAGVSLGLSAKDRLGQEPYLAFRSTAELTPELRGGDRLHIELEYLKEDLLNSSTEPNRSLFVRFKLDPTF